MAFRWCLKRSDLCVLLESLGGELTRHSITRSMNSGSKLPEFKPQCYHLQCLTLGKIHSLLYKMGMIIVLNLLWLLEGLEFNSC